MKNSISDSFLQELGRKITALRLQKNLTQHDFSAQAGVSKSTLERLERGSSIQLVGFLKILKAMDLLGAFQSLLPEESQSPMTRLQLQRQKRQRASRSKSSMKTTWSWKD
jgi:transcriptional regulator with XRE-family HTH domain